MLRSPSARGLSDLVAEALAAGATDSFLVAGRHAVAGSTLGALDLRRRTGALVLAVLRADRPLPGPSPDLTIEAGDVLVLAGSHAAIEDAFRLLEGVSSG